MANDNSLTDVSAAAGQLKNNFSSLERTLIGAVQGTSGALSSGPGLINGSISGALSNASNAARSRLEVGFSVAEQMESTGIALKNSAEIISSTISSAVNNKTAINNYLSKTPMDLSNPNKRLPLSNKIRPDELMKKTKESLVGQDDLNYGGLQFPMDLTENASVYMCLQFMKYSRAAAQSTGSLSNSISIYLPMPDNLAQTFGVLYDPRDTDMLGEAIKNNKIIGAATNVSDGNFENALNDLSSLSNKEGAQLLKAIGQRGIYTSLSSADERLGGLAGQVSGEIPNPHPTVFFKGMQLRTFQFNWRLIPRNAEEAQILQAVLKFIKIYCLPERGGSTTLKYPHLVEIIPGGKGADKIGNYKRSLVSSITINYTAEGTSAFFYDGNPVSIMLSMEFQEVENFTSEDVLR